MRWVSWIVVLGSLVWLMTAGLGIKAPWTLLPGVDKEMASGTIADPKAPSDAQRAFLQSYVDAWGSQNPDQVAALFEKDGTIYINETGTVHGTTGISDHASHHFEDFQHIELDLNSVERQGDTLIVNWVFRAEHRATGRDVSLERREELLLADNGRIHSAHVHFNQASLQRQLAAQGPR